MQDTLAAIILYDESKPGERAVQIRDVDVGRQESCQGLFWNFFDWINKGSFEVSADAFNTFRVRENRPTIQITVLSLIHSGSFDQAQVNGRTISFCQL
jgi:hypothetical protein